MTEPRHRGTARAVALTLALSLSAVPAWVDALSAQPPGGPAAATTVLAVLYGLASVLAVPLVGEARTRTRAGVCAVLLALGAALVVLLGPGHSWALLYGLAVVAVLLPPVAAGAITGVALAALAGFATVSGDLGEQVDDLLLLASVTAAVGLVVRLADAKAELRHARDRVAQLAVLGERDRVSRDLHDVLGHSLTAITMKAGVARLLLEGGHDADGAAAEVRAVEGLSRQALQDVRATVQGYREVTLDGELVVAPIGGHRGGPAARRGRRAPRAPPGVRVRAAGGHDERPPARGRDVRPRAAGADLDRRPRRRCRGRCGRARQRAARPRGAGARRGRAAGGRPGALGRVPGAGERPVIRVLVADDQALVRGALATVLDLQGDMVVVAQVRSGDDIVPAARRTQPDVALLDVQMPGMDGLAATAALRAALPTCRVLVCTTFGRPGYLSRALAAGALGFVVKDAPPEHLVDAVRRVHAGLRVVDPALAAESLAVGPGVLTARERDVLGAARSGGTVADIARALHLSAGTVRNHLSAAIGKTGARTRAEAVRIVDDRGWL